MKHSNSQKIFSFIFVLLAGIGFLVDGFIQQVFFSLRDVQYVIPGFRERYEFDIGLLIVVLAPLILKKYRVSAILLIPALLLLAYTTSN